MAKAKSTALSTGALRPQPHGGALRNGGTNKGGTGRPPDAFKAEMRALADRASQALRVSTILDDPEHEHFLAAAKWVAEHGYGKPKESVEVSGTVAQYVIEVPAKAASVEEWAARNRRSGK